MTRAAAATLVLAACAGNVPEIRYYQLAEPSMAPAREGGVALVIEALATDTAYDDERIVYRLTPYRLDYYNYHRWSAAPGALVGNYLERSFEHSGRFAAVMRVPTPAAALVLGGRVSAIEEVDRSTTDWVGHLVVELVLTDARSGRVLWSQQYEENEPLAIRSPEGLARALGTALERIAQHAVPIVAAFAEEQPTNRTARRKP